MTRPGRALTILFAPVFIIAAISTAVLAGAVVAVVVFVLLVEAVVVTALHVEVTDEA